MKFKITTYLKCPVCHSSDLKKAGKSIAGTQKYQCKDCGWLFGESEANR